MSGYIKESRDGSTLIFARVSPRSARTGALGRYGPDRIKIGLAAAPVDGAANEELIDYLAARLKIRRGDIVIKSGRSSRNKSIAIKNLSPKIVRQRLESPIE